MPVPRPDRSLFQRWEAWCDERIVDHPWEATLGLLVPIVLIWALLTAILFFGCYFAGADVGL